MKPERVPEVVNLVEIADASQPKIEGDKPITVTKAQLRDRMKMKPGEIRYYRGEQHPKYKKSVYRKRACPFCGYSNGRLIAVCLRCKNCMACGSYTGESRDQICQTCGNYNSSPPPPPITINVGV